MRVLLQRVSRAAVRSHGEVLGSIGPGLAILVGVAPADDEPTVRAMADKVVGLRIFADDAGLTNRSILDVGGAALVVSQFTLYADTRRGRRPSFTAAAPPTQALELYERFCTSLADAGVRVERGRFGAPMEVELVNDGPFTVMLDSAER